MKAIILSAGKGSRLYPMTNDLPKCLLPIGETTVLGHQLDVLNDNGIEKVVVVTGFRAPLVEKEIRNHDNNMNVTTVYNPFYQVSDNLASCWMAKDLMDENMLLINGDTLFTPELLRQVLDSETHDIQITIDKKAKYDWDDMKVTLDGDRLLAIGKDLKASRTHGESIGMLRFIGEGVFKFRSVLDDLIRTSDGTGAWFLSAINEIAKNDFEVKTFSIEGSRWAELDTIDDYKTCCALFGTPHNRQVQLSIVATG